MTSERREFDAALLQGQTSVAQNIAINAGINSAGQVRDLLWSLEAATLLRFNSDLQSSTAIFDGTEALIKQEELRNFASAGLSQTASMIINDNVMSYRPTVYDKVMVNTYKAINFWQERDFVNARVEWNRVDDRQRRAAEHFSKQILRREESLNQSQSQLSLSYKQSLKTLESAGINPDRWLPYDDYINPASLYLHGLYFLLNGESDADFDRARSSLSRAFVLTRQPQIKADLALVRQGKALPAGIWVIFENGIAARKIEQRLDLPLFMLTDNIDYVGIALPTLTSGQPAHLYLLLNNNQKTQTFATMDRIIAGEFKTEFSSILIKEISRALLKTAGQSELLSSDNDTVRLVGHISSVIQAATTQADIRSWHSLPYNFQVAYTKWPRSGKLGLTTPSGYPIEVQLPSTPQPVIVYVRAFSAVDIPQVTVLTSKYR